MAVVVVALLVIICWYVFAQREAQMTWVLASDVFKLKIQPFQDMLELLNSSFFVLRGPFLNPKSFVLSLKNLNTFLVLPYCYNASQRHIVNGISAKIFSK